MTRDAQLSRRDPGALLHGRRQVPAPTQTPLDDQHHLQRPDRPEHDQRQHGARSIDLGSNPAAPINQPINLAGKLVLLTARHRHADHQPGGRRPDAARPTPTRSTLFGSGSPVITNPQGIALDGENTVGDSPDRRPAATAFGQRLPRRQLLRLVHHQHDAAVGPGRLAQARPGQRHQHRRRRHHLVDHRRPSTARSASPTPQLVPLAGQTAILDIGIAVLDQRRADDLLRPDPASRQPRQLCRSTSGRTQAPASSGAGGAFQVTVGIDAANTGLVTEHHAPARPARHLQRRARRPALAAARRRQRLLRGSGADHRPERQRVEPERSQRSVAVRRRHDAADAHVHVTDHRPGHHHAAVERPDQLHGHRPARTSIRPTSRAASIQVINAGPDGILGTADDVPVPINPTSIKFTLLDNGDRRPGTRDDHLLDPGHADQQSLSGHAAEHRAQTRSATSPATRRHSRGQRAVRGRRAGAASRTSSSAAHRYVTNPNAARSARRKPVPDDRRGDDGGVPPATSWRCCPGVYTEQVTMKQFVRLLSADPPSTDSTVFTTSTGDAHSDDHPRSVRGDHPPAPTSRSRPPNLESFAGLSTEIAGFSIASPLGRRPGQRLDQPQRRSRSPGRPIPTSWSTRTTSSTPASASRSRPPAPAR